MSYGLEIGDRAEPTPIASGIPTTCGSIVFSNISFHADKLLGYAEGRLPKERFNELKKAVESEDILGEELRYEMGEKLANSLALQHPDVLDYLQFELLVTIPASPFGDAEEEGDAESKIRDSIERLKSILEIYEHIEAPSGKGGKSKSATSMFTDAELLAWNVKYTDRDEVLAELEGTDAPESIIEAWDDLSGYAEEETAEPSFVLLLRSEADAKTTVRTLENQIENEMGSLEGTLVPRSAFITLAA